MNELSFEPEDLSRAIKSQDGRELAKLARQENRYIMARVAGNQYTSRETRDWLRVSAKHSSTTLWLLGNSELTAEEYRQIFDEYIGQAFNGNIHPILAGHKFATFEDLRRLLEKNRWNITMAVLNNRNLVNIPDYKSLIKNLLAPEDTAPRDMDEVQRLAHFRYHGFHAW